MFIDLSAITTKNLPNTSRFGLEDLF